MKTENVISNLNFNASIKINKYAQLMTPNRANKIEMQFAKKTQHMNEYALYIDSFNKDAGKGFDLSIYNEKEGIERRFRLKENIAQLFEKMSDNEIVQTLKKITQTVRKEEILNNYLWKKYDEISNKLNFDAYDGIETMTYQLENRLTQERIKNLSKYGIIDFTK